MLERRLEELRTENKFTKKDVAALLKIDQSTYGKYELGKREPDAEMLTKIAELYNVSVDYLLGLTDIKNPPETIAAHVAQEKAEYGDWTKEELEDIERFKEFVRMKRKQNKE